MFIRTVISQLIALSQPALLLLIGSTGFHANVFAAEINEVEIRQLTVDDYLREARLQGHKANKLIEESSPYLLQHAYNPVNWYAWGEQAFKKAKKENKPIFLSIGYSTCHWCHVMARESFEDKKIAALLNKHFVSIKVDREQRPDIDAVYMAATQLINGHGGWPMTVFLDHDLRPFHAATYYPPFSTDGRLGLHEVLLKIQELWSTQGETVNKVAKLVTAQISATADDSSSGGVLDSNINQLAMRQIMASFDDEMGGFSAAPKFPRPGLFAYLIRVAALATSRVSNKATASKATADEVATNELAAKEMASSEAKKMMVITLDAMAAGGIYDQLAGGFHRYSVDANWQIPHFEKMLYSQALMVIAYNDFYRINAQGPDEQKKYKKIIYQTLDFVKQEMRSPKGGYYSALDADSERVDKKGRKTGEHTEGVYYLWSESELKQLLTKEEYDFVKQYFHIREYGNIFSDPQEEFTNLNIFYIDEDFRGLALSQQQKNWLKSARKKLNKKRRQRPRPHLDDKVIAAWNGMMLSALAGVSQTFDDKRLLDDALQTISYIKNNLYDDSSKKLYRQYRDTKSRPNSSAKLNSSLSATASSKDRIEAILADYVWLINGLLQVYMVSKDEQWLNWALVLHNTQNELFLDPFSGAYFESVASDASLLFRSKNIFDNALPSANAIALSNLRQFSRLLKVRADKKAFAAQADKLVSSFATAVNQNPAAASMLLASELPATELQDSGL